MISAESMAAKASCPRDDELSAFLRGQLASEQLESIAEHLADCATCGGGMEALQARDGLLHQLRRAPHEAEAMNEWAWGELEKRARDIPRGQTVTATVAAATADTVPEGSALPAVFGNYVLQEQLGQGGMGVVFKARQENLKRLVAVKMVRAGIYAGSEERSRFQREGEVVARIRHPHVVQIHEFGEFKGHLYFAMELLEGGTLAAKLKGQPLAEREAAELVRTLAHAVAAAHGQEIVHRDLKPGNVLFEADGTVKIADFGLAKVLDAEDGETISDVILGTPTYMSPEQARGESRRIGKAADIYALGAILYETLTGRPPFRGESRLQTLELVRTREPEPPSCRRPHLSHDLEAICLKCLEKNPDNRYASAEALANDLHCWLVGEPTEARPPGRATRLWRSVRRRARLTSAAALLLLLAVGLPAGLWYRNPERPIRSIEAELARGQPQTLIGETGPPRWFHWHAGRGAPQMSVLADGSFSVHSWGTALLELVRNPRRSHFRLRAEVRHETSAKQAEIGIYVAHRIHPLPAGPVHQFVALSFYDIERDKDLWARVVAKPMPVKPPPPKGNPVMLDPNLYAERMPEPWEPKISCGPRHYFEPVGFGGRKWRELMVEVTPQGVKGFWNGKAFGELAVTRLLESTNNYLAEVRKRQPDEPFAYGFDPGYEPRGGVGLFVRYGSASFRRVVIEPLEDPN